MPLPRSWTNAVLLAALALAGCRLPGREGPVPESLADCRRLSRQGVGAMERGRLQDAESLLAKAVTACPSDAEAHRNYAEALWRRGAKPEAIAQLEEAGRLAPEDISISVRLAEMCLAAGRLEPAWQNAEHALELDLKQPRAWAVRGGVLRATGRPREALADDLRALGYAPKDRDILLEVAELYRELNQPDRALQTLQALAETYSSGEEPGRVQHLMGLAYVALQRYDDAVESLAAAVKREKPSPELYCQLGEAQLLAGRPAEASAAARQALAMQPRHEASQALLNRIEVARQPREETLR